jgi:hypothetical protein
LLSFPDDKGEMYLIQIDLEQKNMYKMVKIRLKTFSVEIDQKDPDKFYFIEDKVVYSMDFSVKESTFGGIFGGGTGSKKNLFGAKEFYVSKFFLEFIRFDKEMENFFINESKTIKMLNSKTFEIVKVFEQFDFHPVDIFFSENSDYMFR